MLTFVSIAAAFISTAQHIVSIIKMAFRAETYSKAEKKTAIGQLRKTRAEAKAWKEDNEQRERDNQPRRTLVCRSDVLLLATNG